MMHHYARLCALLLLGQLSYGHDLPLPSELLKEWSIASIHQCENISTTNNLWLIESNKRFYILRKQINPANPQQFLYMIEAAKVAARCKLAPQIICYDLEEQAVLLEYIRFHPIPWRNDLKTYKKIMLNLRKFHNHCHLLGATDALFQGIRSTSNCLKNDLIPRQLSGALQKIDLIAMLLQPWLTHHAKQCHGDFHLDNILIGLDRNPYFVDFDSTITAHPFWDIVKFTLKLPYEQRIELLTTYLGHTPTRQDLAHFSLLELVHQMVVVLLHFHTAQTLAQESTEISTIPFTQEEVEYLIQAGEPFPSYPYESTKGRQCAGIRVLCQLLLALNATTFTTLLDSAVEHLEI